MISRATVLPATALSAQWRSRWAEVSRTTRVPSPFMTAEYVQAVGAVRPDVYVAVLEDAVGRCAFFPFQFRTRWHALLRAAERVGGELTDYCGVIAPPGFRVAPQELLRRCRLSAFLFSHLDESQQEHGLTGDRTNVGLRVRLVGGSAGYWEALRVRDRKFVADTERRHRRLEAEHGAVRFELTSARPTDELERLISAKRDQYQRTCVPDALGDEWTRNLLGRLLTSNSLACRGVLSTLFAGQTWVGSHFGLQCDSVLHMWFPAYNRALQPFAPGRLLLKAIIEHADAVNVTVLDRGEGDTQAKRDFATEEHRFFRGLWHRPGARATAFRTMMSLQWRVQGAHHSKIGEAGASG